MYGTRTLTLKMPIRESIRDMKIATATVINNDFSLSGVISAPQKCHFYIRQPRLRCIIVACSELGYSINLNLKRQY